MMVQPGGSTTNGTATGTVSPSIQRIPLPGTSIYYRHVVMIKDKLNNINEVLGHVISLFNST